MSDMSDCVVCYWPGAPWNGREFVHRRCDETAEYLTEIALEREQLAAIDFAQSQRAS